MSEDDLQYVEAMAKTLDDYVRSDQLFWKMAGVSMAGTIGGALLRFRRLGGIATQPARLENAEVMFSQKAEQWIVQVEGRVVRELKMRIDNFGSYLDDCIQNSSLCSDYPSRVIHRVAIEELLLFKPKVAPEASLQKLRLVDERLKSISEAVPFVWSGALEGAFPQDPFWMLYLQPSPERIDALVG